MESLINSTERTSFTSFAGSWDVEELMLVTVSLVPLTARELRHSWTAKETMTALDVLTLQAAVVTEMTIQRRHSL